MKETTYKSQITLGQKYQHINTGLIGHAIAIYFFENACERVNLQYLHDGEIKEFVFDSVELKSVDSQERATSDRKGGPRGPSSIAGARGTR